MTDATAMNASSHLQPALVGRWVKITRSACSETYPDRLEYRANGTYRGHKGSIGEDFTVWDAGNWEVVADGQLKISTANDAGIPYRYALKQDRLTFIDGAGCKFSYRRDGPGGC